MIKCKCPNLVKVITDPKDSSKRKALFIPGGKRDYSREFYDKLLEDSGYVEVPCGKCTACRLEYSRVWANRCYIESLNHQFTWFITLSYRDDALAFGDKGFPTLEKDALSNFIRKLRDHFGHDITIRYFGCGEYGDQTMRPHYHVIVFGAPLDDLDYNMPDMSKPLLPSGKYPIFRRKNSNGDYVYFSQTVYDCWQKGKIEVEEAGWNCAAYVSRYVMKKQKGIGAEIYKRLGIFPEYLRMSNRPGIGADWLNENKEKLLKNDYMSVKNRSGVQTSHPPRYFEKLMMKDEDSREYFLMQSNKIDRISNAKIRCKDSNTTKSVGQQLEDEADFIEKKTKVLNRDIT